MMQNYRDAIDTGFLENIALIHWFVNRVRLDVYFWVLSILKISKELIEALEAKFERKRDYIDLIITVR